MYIGIDLGTSSMKFLLMDVKGNILKVCTEEYPLLFPKENWFEQNPEEWFNAAISGLKKLILGYEKEIKSISFSGQMHGLVILDDKDNLIRPAILWCDQRTEKQCDYLNTTIGAQTISNSTGNIALTGFTAPKLLWLKEYENENFKKINKIMLPKDYLAYKLSGVFSTDFSDASGTLFLDVKNRCWSKDMLEILDISLEQLPRLYESYEVIGEIKEQLAEELFLNKNVKIIAGGGDQAVGAVGIGAVTDGIISVSLGTSGVVFASSSKYEVVPENKLHSFCHSNGQYHQMGVMLSAASALKWWIETIQNSKDYFTLVETDAANSEIENLYFLPYLMGERTPHNNPNAKGVFMGMTIQHEAKHLTRAILEGISFGLKDSLEILKESNIKIEQIRISGGGAKSEFWRQLIADIFDTKIQLVNSTEGPAYGAAILAAVGDAAFSSVNEACSSLITILDEKIPNKTKVSLYEKKYETFKSLYPALKSYF